MARTQPENVSAIAKRIRNVDDVTPYAKVCVFGPNGSRKTRLAASAPNVLIVDINEQGTRSAVGSNAKVFEARTWDDIGKIYWYLKAGNHKHKSVALDTITQMQELALDFVLGEKEERDPGAEKSSPTQRDYGRSGKLMRSMLLAFRNLDMHVIFVAQERAIEDEDTEELSEITVDLPKSSRGTATGCVGILGRTMVRQTRVRDKKTKKVTKEWQPILVVGDHDTIRTKDRTYALPSIVRKPTMSMLIEAWENNPPEETE